MQPHNQVMRGFAGDSHGLRASSSLAGLPAFPDYMYGDSGWGIRSGFPVRAHSRRMMSVTHQGGVDLTGEGARR